MFLIPSEADLLKSFRPADRRVVEVPRNAAFPFLVRDYRAWAEEAGTRMFLVFRMPDSKWPVGLVLRKGPGGGAPTSHLCDWCHSPGSSGDIGLMTVQADDRRVVGTNVCLDLRCAERLETAANLSGRHPRALQEQLLERIVRFAREAVGMGDGTRH
jgi:hypothetical protein